MIDGTEKPKIPSNKKPIFGEQRSSVVRIVQNFFTAGSDSGQPRRCQNIVQFDLHKRHDSLCRCYFISFRHF